MAATFPGGVKVFTTKQAGDQIASAHINDLQDEVVAVETELRKTTGSVVSHGSLAGLSNNDHPQYVRGVDLGIWTAYTPTWTAVTTNPSIGNGTLSGRYVQIGKTVICSIALVMGSTTTYGSGNWSFSLPKTAANSGVYYGGQWMAVDVGTINHAGQVFVFPNASVINYFLRENVAVDLLNSTTPHTWASGDVLRLSVIYEVA